jgi:hypothetical protein
MKKLNFLPVLAILFFSCSSQKSFFTAEVRARVESSSTPVSKLQFYIDQDVELRREVTADEAKVTTDGKVILLNGKYVNVILLKKNTPGVCTNAGPNKLDIAFETGDGKSLTFGVLNSYGSDGSYRIFADAWNNEHGRIRYDGKLYNIQPNSIEAKLMIKKKEADKFEITKRTMKGRKVS